MRAQRLWHVWGSSFSSSVEGAKGKGFGRVGRVEDLDRNAEVDEHVGARLGAGQKRERDHGAIVQPAGARATDVPDVDEPGDRAEAHQPASTSTASTSTSAPSPSSTSTIAPSATVPAAASAKCARKCSGVK